MAVWETEDESSPAPAVSIAAPMDAPFRTPSRSSRRSRRSVTPPNVASSSPAPMPTDKTDKSARRSSRDVTNDETISILDPRRFTPTLHANLVSEILNLRRDQDEKMKFIDSLEQSLQSTREEHETAQATLLNTAKENRSLKRQLALLEGGTSSALGELARERDEAVDAITETKKRFETAQKKLRTQEEDSERVHDLWAKEKDAWEEEKRKYERKVHVAETRLKAVLDEVATFQAAQASNMQNGAESENEEANRDNDGASIRSMSITNSVRYSVIGGPGKLNGHSLADELNFDIDEDEQTDYDGRESALSNVHHKRNPSRDSMMSRTHRRNQSSENFRPGSVARGRLFMNPHVLERLEDGIREDDENLVAAPKVEYTDTGIQFSPPPSPKIVPAKPSTPEPMVKLERLSEIENSPQRGEWEIEANQRRKRVHISKPMMAEPPLLPKLMVSTSSQTMVEPISPPRTPKSEDREDSLPLSDDKIDPIEMVSCSTQTDPAPLQPPVLANQMQIPSISIVPPTSRPSTPREHRLPQYVKDFGCQVSLIRTAQLKSTAIQTDEIRIDQRLAMLPPHLHPSAISSRPVSPNAAVEDRKPIAAVPGSLPPRNPRRLVSKRGVPNEISSSPPPSPPLDDEIRDEYPGNNDNGPLSREKAPMKRPHRISSLFAGFDGASSDDADEFADGDGGDGSDSEFRTALSAPRPKSTSTRASKRISMSPDQVQSTSKQPKSVMRSSGSSEIYSSFALESRDSVSEIPGSRLSSRSGDKAITMSTGSRASVMRKAAMIQNSIATHQVRPRSPSLPESRDPPFPIPTRASSRKPPTSASAPSDGQRSPTRTSDSSWHRRGMRSSTSYRSNSIRKVRSAAALPRNHRTRRSSRSPPPFSPSEEAPESPTLPPLPSNDLTTPRNRDYNTIPRYRTHKSQPSTTTANTAITENTNMGSVGSSQQASGVVDAIAQTMVGEWMYKYVRRRKSFSVADPQGKDENSNDRHKRWVWLGPYERSILWSSKQPVSGSALMGKSGRKLVIQSVLDVKDDNPAPKGVTQIFNRSILILTPQRALKFTATSAERHYLWLTALSFLAHSSAAVPDIIAPTAAAAAPPPPPSSAISRPPPDFEAPKSKGKRPGIRDSIRLTKGKNPSFVRPELPVNSSQLEEALAFKPETFAPVSSHQRELSREVAEPPYIPRFHERNQDRVHERVTERANQVVLHGRKRSNTGGHVPPPLSFRGFSGPVSNNGSAYHQSTSSTAGMSVGTATSSGDYQSQAGSASNHTWGMSTTGSVRTSEASSRPAVPNNFFEAIGTVRMEAFISPLAGPRVDSYPDEQEEFRHRVRRRSKEMRRRRSRSRHRDSYYSRGTHGTDDYYGGSRTGAEEDFFARDDPFKGF